MFKPRRLEFNSIRSDHGPTVLNVADIELIQVQKGGEVPLHGLRMQAAGKLPDICIYIYT
jgi:hypothetical protein